MEETLFTGFVDRADGGRRLAERLLQYRGKSDAIVIGLPRGGVVTAAAVAEALDLPLDLLVVRKLGTPGEEELAMGAIAAGGVRVLNDEVVDMLHIPASRIDEAERRERVELERRNRLFRGDAPPLDLAGKTVIVVDDGLATGSTVSAAVAVLRKQRAKRIVLAVPVAPLETIERIRPSVDELVYLETPEPFGAVGYWYVDFAQVEDAEVVATLARAREAVAV